MLTDIEALIARLEAHTKGPNRILRGTCGADRPTKNVGMALSELREIDSALSAAAKVIRALSGAVEAERERCAAICAEQATIIGALPGSSIYSALYGTAAAIRVKEEL